MAIDKKGYVRPNFFEGLIVKEEDLNDILRYTVDKHRLYNQYFHSPGVVAGVLGELRVTARERGDLSFEISGGYAIDGQGMPRRAGRSVRITRHRSGLTGRRVYLPAGVGTIDQACATVWSASGRTNSCSGCRTVSTGQGA